MKTLIVLFLFMSAAFISHSQAPAPDPDTLQNPVKQTDPEVKQLPPDLHYTKDDVRINASDLPAAVLDSLKKLEPSEWEKSVVYRNKTEGTFTIEIRASGKEKTYRFNEEGNLLKPTGDDND